MIKQNPKKMGRPFGEPKRQVRLRWPVKVAEWIERNRDKIVKLGRRG